MIEPQSYDRLRQSIADQIAADRGLLDDLRAEVRPLRQAARPIQPRQTTAISLVGTDGGQNQITFDPFLIQLIRVVDSSNNEYCLDVVTANTNLGAKSEAQFHQDGRPRTALGELMAFLGVRHVAELSSTIRVDGHDRPLSARWGESYRELVEWAVLFSILRHTTFGTDTLLVFDGLLRSKVFRSGLFARFRAGLDEAIEHHTRRRRQIYVVGVAKQSKVLTRYRLAMALEGVLGTAFPAYVEIPRALEARSYEYADYARGDDVVTEFQGENRFVAGKLFLVKFGPRPLDPIWPVDILIPQIPEASRILGHMLSDAANGFPVPFYPLCLQRAHEHAALVDFDSGILQDQIVAGLRALLGPGALDLDVFRLKESDPARRRYSFYG